MKRVLSILLTVFFCFAFTITALAAEKEEAAPEPAEMVAEDASMPRVMVTDFSVDGGSITPNKKSEVTITFKNYSKTKAVKNIKLSLTEESGDIKPVGTGTQYVEKINAGKTYKWTVKLTASKTAEIGEHAITVACEYEDKYYTQYTASDIIRVNVKQSVGLDYSGVQLPAKVTQADTVTLEISLLNTGKSNIRNCKLDFDIEGLESGGSTYIGEIPAGESTAGTANLRVSSEKLGTVSGTVTISYEDEFGKEYKKTAEVSTAIVEKVIEQDDDEEEEKKNPQWWAFLLGGVVLGGGVGCAIPLSISSYKARKEDELRL
ncbi:MAG: COG1361 S-layer family protein [Eubacterium sp.]